MLCQDLRHRVCHWCVISALIAKKELRGRAHRTAAAQSALTVTRALWHTAAALRSAKYPKSHNQPYYFILIPPAQLYQFCLSINKQRRRHGG